MRTGLLLISLAGIAATGCDGKIGDLGINVTVGPNIVNAIKGSGNSKTETREVPEFSAVDVSSIIKAEVKLGEKTTVTLSGDDNLVSLVETEVRDGRLVAKLKDNSTIAPKLPLLLSVTTPRLNSLSAEGAAQIEATGTSSEPFTATASGGAIITMHEIATSRVTLNAQGASRITAAGTKTKATGSAEDALKVDAAGGAVVSVKDVIANDVTVQADGASRVTVAKPGNEVSGSSAAVKINAAGGADVSVRDVAAKTLTINAQGASRVTAAGNAKNLKLDLGGGANVSAGELTVETVDARVSGAARTEVNASQSVTGDVSGGGHLSVRGKPAKRSVSRSGAGQVSYP